MYRPNAESMVFEATAQRAAIFTRRGWGAKVNMEPEQMLFAGERILWTGRAQRARRSVQELGTALYLAIGVPLVLALIVLPIFKHPQPWWFIASSAIVAISALGQGVGYLIYLLVVQPRVRASVIYAVTDQRIIVTAGLRTRVANSAYVSALPKPELVQHGDGTSTLRFGNGSQAKRPTLVRLPLRREVPTLTLPALSGADATTALAAIQQARTSPSRGEANTAWSAADSPPALTEATPAGWTSMPGEQVLWIGRPGRMRWWYGGYDVYTSLFGVAWTVAVGVMEALAISQHVWPFAIFALVFAALGVHMMFGRLLWRRTRVRRSIYLVTSQRVATVWNLRRPRVVSAALSELRPAALSDQGTLTFEAAAPATRQRSGQTPASMLSPAATHEAPVFLDLADAATVYRIVGAAQAGAIGLTTSRA